MGMPTINNALMRDCRHEHCTMHPINNAHREHPCWTPLHAPGLKPLAIHFSTALRIGLCTFSSYTITSLLSSEHCHFSSRGYFTPPECTPLKVGKENCDASCGQAVKQLQIVLAFLLKFPHIISFTVPQTQSP